MLSDKVKNAIQTGIIQVTNTNDLLYIVWKYDRNMVADDNLELGAYRSLVFSSNTGQLLCYAPEKSLPKQLFFEPFQDREQGMDQGLDQTPVPIPDPSLLCVTETVEGTMINLFWNPDIEQWEIATRSGVGGHYWYNRNNYGPQTEQSKRQKTFRQMFIECLNGDSTNLSIGAIPGIDYLSRAYCYSFVIQHPSNHFVYRIRRPSATLVAVYQIVTNIHSSESIYRVEWIDYDRVCEETGQLIYAQTAAAIGCISTELVQDKTEQLNQLINNQNENSKQDWFHQQNVPMGYMVVNRINGYRYSIENPNYAKIKELRGNHPNIQFQYLALNRAGKVTEFLSYFPQYKKQFFQFYKQYHEFITEVHNVYVNYYVQKKRDLVPKKYFVHASKIHHNVYLPSIANEQKTIITHRVVREYFDELSPSSQIYYLNLE
jgi:hypothetical protein